MSTDDFNAGILRILLGRKPKMIKRPTPHCSPNQEVVQEDVSLDTDSGVISPAKPVAVAEGNTSFSAGTSHTLQEAEEKNSYELQLPVCEPHMLPHLLSLCKLLINLIVAFCCSVEDRLPLKSKVKELSIFCQ